MSGGGKGSQTIGFRYFMGVHFGIGLGPMDELNEIAVGDRTAYGTTITDPGSGISSFSINKPDLFGGEKKEGGIKGSVELRWGHQDQGTSSYLASKQGGLQPAYRGLVTLVYNGLIACMNPYPKPWAFRFTRILSGWSTPVFAEDLATITYISDGREIKAMNPAHIIYQCITDTNWGMGYPASSIDLTSFTHAARGMVYEQFGLCLKWNRQDTIESFIQIVADHIGAVVTNDRRTGKFRLDLIRADYEPDSIPRMDKYNIVELVELDSTTLEDSINEITVVWHDPLTNKDGTVTLQSLAGIQAQGGRVVAARKEYPGLPMPELAAKLGLRDLKAASSGLKRVHARLDSSGYALRPGMAIRFTWEPDGLDIIMRIGSVDYGTLSSGIVTVVAVEDVFGLPSSTYTAVQNTEWEAPATTALPITYSEAYESSYRDNLLHLSAGDFSVLPEDIGYTACVALRPTSTSQNYDIRDRTGSDDYESNGSGDFCSGGLLSADLNLTATSATLTSAKDLDLAVVGAIGMIGDSELIKLLTVDATTGVITFTRGCCDTVPSLHEAGDAVYLYGIYEGFGTKQWMASEVVQVKLLTQMAGDVLAEGSAGAQTIVFNSRKERPYAPGKVQLEGVDYNPVILTPGDKDLTWTHRDRLAQADQIIDTQNASIGPEAGTTYTIRTYNGVGTLVDTFAGVTGTTQTIPAPATGGVMTIKLKAVRDGYDSYQEHVFDTHWPGDITLALTGVFGTGVVDDVTP